MASMCALRAQGRRLLRAAGLIGRYRAAHLSTAKTVLDRTGGLQVSRPGCASLPCAHAFGGGPSFTPALAGVVSLPSWI